MSDQALFAGDRFYRSQFNTGQASYTVFQKDGVTYADPGYPGGIPYSNMDPAFVINSAIAAMTNGGKIFVRNAAYNCSNGTGIQRITLVSNLIIEFELGASYKPNFGVASYVLPEGPTSYPIFFAKNLSNITLRNIKVDGSLTGTPCNGFYFEGCSNYQLYDCESVNSTDGIYSDTNNTDYVIERFKYSGVDFASGSNAGIDNYNNPKSHAKINGCTIIGDSTAGHNPYGILLSDTEEAFVTHNTIKNTDATGIWIQQINTNSSRNHVKNNLVDTVKTSHGIKLSGNSSINNQISGNIVKNCAGRGISDESTSTTNSIVNNDVSIGNATGLFRTGAITRNNQGYNPQPTGSVTAGASPWTYTNNDGYDEILELTSANGITGTITYRGDSGYSIGNRAFPFLLGPGETIVVTWTTTAPVFGKMPR